MSELRPGELKPDQRAAMRTLVPRGDEIQRPSEPRRRSRRGFIGLAVGAIAAAVGIKSYIDSNSANVQSDPTVPKPTEEPVYQEGPYPDPSFAGSGSEHESAQQPQPIDPVDPDAVPVPEPIDIDRGYRRRPDSEPGVPMMKPTNFVVNNTSDGTVAIENKDSKKGSEGA